MRTAKKITIIFLVSLFVTTLLWAAEEPEVAIQKTEGRTEAVVSSAGKTEQKPQKKPLTRIISAPGDAIVGIGKLSSSIVGKITDTTVRSVQTVGGFLFAPVFKTLDIQGKFKGKQDSKG